jgi:NADPH:quinone reductase-like Zn-dependent oxidoreductase
MGTACIQFAKLSGFTVITTCSPHNFELVKAYGADHVFDYHDPAAPEQVRALLGGQDLKYAIDCISKPGFTVGTGFCGPLLAPGGIYSVLAPMVTCEREDVTDVPTVGFSFLGEEWSFMGQTFPASPEDFEFSRSFAVVVEKLWAKGEIRPHPVEVREGGLEVFPKMMEDLEKGRVSGRKLVVEV